LRRFMKRCNKYGQLTMAVLAPVLVGIPSYTFVSKRLNQDWRKTFAMLTLSILGWSGLAYGCFLLLDVSSTLPSKASYLTQCLKKLNSTQ
ncbi:hypothetical protein L4D02_13180, partial [Vibrio splendidus]